MQQSKIQHKKSPRKETRRNEEIYAAQSAPDMFNVTPVAHRMCSTKVWKYECGKASSQARVSQRTSNINV
jgi:hypothetical protein